MKINFYKDMNKETFNKTSEVIRSRKWKRKRKYNGYFRKHLPTKRQIIVQQYYSDNYKLSNTSPIENRGGIHVLLKMHEIYGTNAIFFKTWIFIVFFHSTFSLLDSEINDHVIMKLFRNSNII